MLTLTIDGTSYTVSKSGTSFVSGDDLPFFPGDYKNGVTLTDTESGETKTSDHIEILYCGEHAGAHYLAFRIVSDAEAGVDLDAVARPVDTVPAIFPDWTAGIAYKTGNRVNRNGVVYKVLQDHKSQDKWKPESTPALYAISGSKEAQTTEWKQPTGAHDAYKAGARVTLDGKTYISKTAANVWKPGIYGWEEVTEDTTTGAAAEWKQPTGAQDSYKTGDRVTYNGQTYESIIDGNVWAPDAYPAGWQSV